MSETEFQIPEKRYVAHDGTVVSYWLSRPPAHSDQGLTLVLANGIGISRLVWQDLVETFRDRYTLLFWDYRSFYRSATPRDLARLTLADHGRDIAGILEAEKLRDVVMIGWSMGVQVSLEAWRFAGHRLRGMVLMNGTAGRTFDTAFGVPGLVYWVPPLTRYLMTRHPRPLNRVMKGLFRKELEKVMRGTGIVSRDVDRLKLQRLLEEYAKHDFSVYFRLLNELGHHTPDHLEQIKVPALVLVGEKDTFTPPLAGKRLKNALPMAELDRVKRGTHYMIIEYSEQIGSRIERFIDERVR